MKALKEQLTQTGNVVIIQQSQSLEIRPQRQTKTCHLSRNQGAREPPSTFALMAGSDGNQKSACVYCGQHHPSVQCNIVTNVQKRKEILKNSGSCFIRIRKYHHSKNCRSRSRCSKCHGRHHSSICDPTETTKSPISTENQKLESVVDEKGMISPVNMSVGTKSTVLLQTENATIYGGSQRSYITERVRDALHLPVSHSESLTSKPFGSNTANHFAK